MMPNEFPRKFMCTHSYNEWFLYYKNGIKPYNILVDGEEVFIWDIQDKSIYKKLDHYSREYVIDSVLKGAWVMSKEEPDMQVKIVNEKYENFKEIVTTLYNEELKSRFYMENVPNDIRDAIQFNQYVLSCATINDYLLNKLLGEELAELVGWFLYDTSTQTNPDIINARHDNREYKVYTLDQFLMYMYVEYFQPVHE